MPRQRLNPPPVNVPMVGQDGKMTPAWAKWLQVLYENQGGAAEALPVDKGGTNATTVTGVLAVQQGIAAANPGQTVATTSTATTKRLTVGLNSPATDIAGDTADTTFAWNTPFASANYDLTATFTGTGGFVEVVGKTAAGATLRLTNLNNSVAFGDADCIGIHS